MTPRPAQSRPAARRVAGRRARPSPRPATTATEPQEVAEPPDTAADEPAIDEPAVEPEPTGKDTGEDTGEETGEDTGDDTGAADEPEPTGRDGAGPGRRLPRWLPIVSAVLIVVFLATTGILSWRLYEGHAREVSRNDVLRIVPSYAARIFSFDYRHLDQDAHAAHPLLVGAYRDDYDKSMKRRAPDYTKYHYIVKSTVASAGVSDASADRVRVVAFIDQTVTAGVPKSATTQEQIRLALTFERHDGSWLLAQVAAV